MSLLKTKVLLALILLVVTISLSGFSILNNRQLHGMGGMAEEYFHLALNLHYTGKFTNDGKTPFVFRPPGYPFFIASALKISGRVPEKDITYENPEELEKKIQELSNVICFAQCILLSFSAVILFLWLANHFRLLNAFILALLFGCNPYMLILTGLFHYDMLHIFSILISSYVLTLAVPTGKDRPVKPILLILAGLLWGLTTLIRPVTLILPAFVAVMFLLKFKASLKPVLKYTALFILGMFLTICPYTIRNYTVTKRIIPVNAQGSIALWAGTVRILPRTPNHFRWWDLWYNEGMEVYHRVTSVSQYSFAVYIENLLELEDEFKKEAINNLRRKPAVYFHNFIQNIVTFNLDINSVFVKLFQLIQQPESKIDKKWFRTGNPQDFHPSSTANAFKLFIGILTLFCFAGICTAIRQKDKTILVPAIVYLCICAAHCITYMDLMYYYVKIPFLFVFTGYLINAMDTYAAKIPFTSYKFPLGLIPNILLTVFTITLIIAIIL